MNWLLALSILGMAVAAAVAVLMIPALFASTVPGYALPALASAGFVFVTFAVSAFIWRRRMRQEQAGHPDS